MASALALLRRRPRTPLDKALPVRPVPPPAAPTLWTRPAPPRWVVAVVTGLQVGLAHWLLPER